jgi:hypothetical protein
MVAKDLSADGVLENLCKKIEHLTDINDHTGALKVFCGMCGYEDLCLVLDEVKRLHDLAGRMSSELLQVRRKIHEIAMKNLYSDYSSFVYESIKKSF